MSFGFAVGDFLAVGQLCWTVYKKCKDSPGNYAELSSEVGALHNVIKETEELLSQQDLTTEQKVKLTTCRQGCEDVLEDLDGLLAKYESLGTKSRRTFDRMGFGMQDMTGIRLRLISNVTMLDAFNNTSSHARLENKLNRLIAEVRAGKRDGSIISAQTFDTVAQNDQENWEALRQELEDIGISPSVVIEKRHFIIAWFQEAIAAGKLDEDAPSDANGSDVSLGASENLVEGSDGGIASPGQTSSSMIERPTRESKTTRASRPSAHRLSRQAADRPPPREASFRPRFTDLLNFLRGRDLQFLEAAMKGDVTTIERLLEKGVNIQATKNTALHLVTRNGKEAAVRLLLRKGADIEATTEGGETALHLAAGGGYERLIKLFLGVGADLESRTSLGSTALMFAAQTGHLSVVQPLLEKGADVSSVNFHGYTALHYAANNGAEAVVRILLEKGADIKYKNEYGNTALMVAAEYGFEPTVRLLLEKGADSGFENYSGRTALIAAARNGHESTVRLLLEKGADIKSKDFSGSTAMIHAAMEGRESTVRLLLEKGADLNTRNVKGKTALGCASDKSMKQLLLNAAARM